MKTAALVLVSMLSRSEARADLTGMGALTTTDNPATLAVAGVSLLDGGALSQSENPSATPFHHQSLAVFSTTPLSERLQSRERQISVSRGAAAAFSLGSPIGRMGFSAGILNRETQTRFAANADSTLGYESRDIEMRPGVGVRLFDELAVGISAVYSRGEDRIRQWNPGLKIEEQTYQGLAPRLTAHVRWDKISAAIAWQNEALMSTRKRIRPVDTEQLGTPYKAARFALAAGYEFPSLVKTQDADFLQTRILSQLDINYFPARQQIVLRPGSRVYKQSYWLYAPWESDAEHEPERMDTRPRSVPRAALETTLVRSRTATVSGAVGAYLEPPLTSRQRDRFHNTAGMRVAVWGVSAEFGCDFAERYRNYHIGAGASIPLE